VPPSRSPWLPRVVLGVLGLAVLAAIVSISVGQGGSDRVTISGAGEMQQLIGGIQQDGAYIGDPDAPVTATVFNDLQAPIGADFQLDVVDPLIEEYVRTGDVRLELRHYSFTGRATNLAAYGAVSAGEQDRQWQFADLFFRNQNEAPGATVTDEFLRDIANAVPELDAEAWEDDLDSAEVADRVEADGDLATQLEVPAAPAVVVTGPTTTRELDDGPTLSEIEAAIASVQ
jgi:protein-disulfide isomerase